MNRLRQLAWPLVAVALMAAALGLQERWHAEDLARWERLVLPGFDARVYQAMAEAPAVFTLPPWGFRVLVPALVHVVPGPAGPLAFQWVARAGLLASALLLFLWLRRLGHAPWAAALAVLVFGLTPPVAEAAQSPFLAEPVLVALLLAFLWALEADVPLGWLAALGVAGVLGKEVFLGFLPLAALRALLDRGWRRALAVAAATLAPAALAFALLRAWPAWLPPESGPLPTWDVFWLAAWRILEGWRFWWLPALLLGLTPAALLGALRPAARPFLWRYGWLLAVAWALPFLASVYTDDQKSVPFFPDDIPRLLMYAVPPLLHLALLALDRLRAEWQVGPAAPARWRLGWLGWGLTCALLAGTYLGLDPYRRVDLRGPRDGPLVQALCSQSLAQARRLESGRPVALDVAERRFDPQRSDQRHLERMRWFLRAGWGPSPHYQPGPARTTQRRATLLLPCLRPDDWTLTLRLGVPTAQRLELSLNGGPLASLALRPAESRYQVAVPSARLFRGDNELALEAEGPGIELEQLRLVPRGTRLPAQGSRR